MLFLLDLEPVTLILKLDIDMDCMPWGVPENRISDFVRPGGVLVGVTENVFTGWLKINPCKFVMDCLLHSGEWGGEVETNPCTFPLGEGLKTDLP